MMTGLDLASYIKQTLIDEGVWPAHSRTWRNKPHVSDMVTWYGMALNLSGWDYCDTCGNEAPDAEMYRPEPEADCCLCRWCYRRSGETGWVLGNGAIGDHWASGTSSWIE